MEGVSMIMTIDEYVESKIVRITKVVWLIVRTILLVIFIREINFSSNVYSKSLLKGSPLSCTSLEEIISSLIMDTDILEKGKKDISSPHNGQRYFRKVCYLWNLNNHKVVYRYGFRWSV